VNHLGPFLRHFLAELKRRRVLRVAAGYAAGAFVVAQAADIVLRALGVPDWSMTLLVVLLLLGFPFALVLAWIFDVSAAGLVRTESAGASAPAPVADGMPGARPVMRPAAIAAVAGTLILAVAVGAVVLRTDDEADEPDRELSVAVLPFKNQSGAEDGRYISDGLTEAIQTRLNRIENLRVTSITSVMSYRDTSKRMREIAQELGVDHVVEGSLRLVGTRMRISARLIEAATDRTLWADTFDREFDDVFAVETEIAEQIAEGMRLRLTAAQRGRIGERGTNSVVAYDLYMKARNLLRGAVDLDQSEARNTFYGAVSLLRQALDADPEYAAAWAELSGLYLNHIDLAFEMRLDSARVMAARAIRIAPHVADGYVAMGDMLRWGPDSLAARQYELALEREPNHVGALLGAARLARGQLRLVDQARLAHRAAQLAPTDYRPVEMLAYVMENLGDYETAEQLVRRLPRLAPQMEDWHFEMELARLKAAASDTVAAGRHLDAALARAPDMPTVWRVAANLLMQVGRNADALRYWERYLPTLAAVADVDGMPADEKWFAWYGVGYTLAALGDTARGHEYLRAAEAANLEFRRRRCPDTCRNTALAELNAYRGDVDRAVEFLEHSIRVGWVGLYPGSPFVARMFRNIEADPRYRRIMGDLIADFDRQREEVRRAGLHRL
jgi:adenylate cyclase